MPSASQPPLESPTLGAHIVVIPDYNWSENLAGLLFGGPALYDDDVAGDLDFPRGDPPDPPSDDDLNFPAEDLYPDNSDEEPEVKHVPLDTLIQLASAIQSLAHSSRRPSSNPTPCTKVREPDQFDGTDPQKLRVFLVQLKLNFQDCSKTFHTGRAKVTFAQSYLKGMALEWFEPDFLLTQDLALRPLWQDDFKEFVLELQTNFGLHDPVRDAEHQLDHLFLKDGQQINKYVVEFNRIALQIRGYEEGAFWHHFYNGLPTTSKMRFLVSGSPPPSPIFVTLSRL